MTPHARTHHPLFNPKVVDRALQGQAPPPNEAHRAAADWASRVRDLGFTKIKEEAIRGLFTQRVIVEVLGYRPVHPSEPFSVAEEEPIGSGSVDRALGRFSPGKREVVAPFELKGPKTADLDAIMPGRAKSPTQQAWEYAIDTPGARWVLVSNCAELRLYAFGRGRSAYERWDLATLDQPRELERLCLLLSAENLLGGATDALLADSNRVEREITDTLYRDYKALRDRLITVLGEKNPGLDRLAAIEYAQKLLDRTLFVAFAEKTGLLPRDTLGRAFRTRNPFAPQPVWGNFKGMFHAIDKGNADLNIPAYNGGLFAGDCTFDNLSVPDEICESLAKLGDYDFATEVPVLILGRIFEQSISDLEAIHAEARGEDPPRTAKRKREGVVYTPEFVTRFIVERVIGRTLAERFAFLLREHNGARQGKNGTEVLTFSGKAATRNERAFWEAYQDMLRRFTVLDPACGSGAFLVASFDFLAAEYKRVNDRLADIGGRGTGSLFDPNHDILSGNLFGVDVSHESVEITKLSLWLKTAQRGKPLESLEANIRVGNSLIGDADYHQRAFNWQDAFSAVFEAGGFDAVIGNPPYVRMELIKPFKPYLQARYAVVADRADLYAYFYELGLRHLKPGGRLGYISSSTFFRTGSGAPLRHLLSQQTELEDVVDFGDLQLFDGVTTYPAIIITRRPKAEPATNGSLRFLHVRGRIPEELSRTFELGAAVMPRSRLGRQSWQFEDDPPAQLRGKLSVGRRTLQDVYGPPLWGIKTGLNAAFVVDRATRDRLAIDEAHAALLVRFLRGEDVRRWRIESEDLWLINVPKGRVRIEDYPAIREHLLPYKDRLEKRATNQAWFELQQAQLAYQPRMTDRKVIYPHFADEPSFAIDEAGYFSNNKTFFIPGGDYYLLSLLNSQALWFVFSGFSTAVRGGYREHAAQWIGQLPVPEADDGTREAVSELARQASHIAATALELEREVQQRVPDLCPAGRQPRMSDRLFRWWALEFPAFRAEVRRAFGADIPVRERTEWEGYLADNRRRLADLRRQIEATEISLHRLVCDTFDLTAAEVDLLAGPRVLERAGSRRAAPTAD